MAIDYTHPRRRSCDQVDAEHTANLARYIAERSSDPNRPVHLRAGQSVTLNTSGAYRRT